MTDKLSLVELMQVSRSSTTNIFDGHSISYDGIGIYGGHLLGQALSSALNTVDEEKFTQSFHAYFVNRGDPERHFQYKVTNVRRGKGSEIRNIVASQGDLVLLHMTAAFKIPEEGDVHQPTAPATLSAQELIAKREARGEEPYPFPFATKGLSQLEFVDRSFDEAARDNHPALRVWIRASERQISDVRIAQSVLAYLSDSTLLFNSVMPHGTPMVTHRCTSLDHNVWFHRPADPSNWMLFDQTSTAAVDGRGMNKGEIYDDQGILLMTCAQESMLRRIKSA